MRWRRSLGPVTVTVGAHPPTLPAPWSSTSDPGTRRRPAAADTARRSPRRPARHHAHKIDSLLRGNWAHELVAVHRATGGRVLLVPALPRLGRVCRGGVVHVDGAPVGARDARRAASSPRPADHLAGAGATDVVELADADGGRRVAGGRRAVRGLRRVERRRPAAIAAVWRGTDGVRFAGTAGSVAAAVAATAGARVDAVADAAGRRRARRVRQPARDGAGPARRARVRRRRHRARARRSRTARWSPTPTPSGWPPSSAPRPATLLAARPFGVLVIVGGDTAAAVLGDEPLVVGGTLAPGMPWSRRADGSGPLVVTKAGGFGHRDTLVDLLAGRRPSEER